MLHTLVWFGLVWFGLGWVGLTLSNMDKLKTSAVLNAFFVLLIKMKADPKHARLDLSAHSVAKGIALGIIVDNVAFANLEARGVQGGYRVTGFSDTQCMTSDTLANNSQLLLL
jgi:hypothetical protein